MVTYMQVLHRLHQCSCKEKLEVKSCGHGKFVITKAGKKMTLYARVRSNLPSSWKCVDPFMASCLREFPLKSLVDLIFWCLFLSL